MADKSTVCLIITRKSYKLVRIMKNYYTEKLKIAGDIFKG